MSSQAFGVFSLAAGGRVDVSDAGMVRHFARLALKANVDQDALVSQFSRVEPIARNIASTSGVGSLAAWQTAMQRINGRSSLRASYVVDALFPVLQDYCAFVASSSGVEQSFTKGQWAFTDRQGSASESTEENVLKLVLDNEDQTEKTKTCELARQVWAQVYATMERASPKHPRLDAGTTRQSTKPTSEIAFLRLRRKPLAESEAGGPEGVEVAGDPDLVWDASHQKELDFTADKAQKRKRQACFENLLLPDETSELLEAQVQDDRKKMKSDLQKREQQRRRSRLQSEGRSQIIHRFVLQHARAPYAAFCIRVLITIKSSYHSLMCQLPTMQAGSLILLGCVAKKRLSMHLFLLLISALLYT